MSEPPEIVLQVQAQPRAKRNEVAGWRGEALVVRVTAPPEKGRANRAIIETLAEALGVRRSALRLVAGETSRAKRVAVAGLTMEQVRARLARAP